MTIETARRASLEFVCVFGQDAIATERCARLENLTGRPEVQRLLPVRLRFRTEPYPTASGQFAAAPTRRQSRWPEPPKMPAQAPNLLALFPREGSPSVSSIQPQKDRWLRCRRASSRRDSHVRGQQEDTELGLRYNRSLVSALAIDGDGKAKLPEHSRSVSRPFEADEFRTSSPCLLFIHPRAPNLISLRSAGTMPA